MRLWFARATALIGLTAIIVLMGFQGPAVSVVYIPYTYTTEVETEKKWIDDAIPFCDVNGTLVPGAYSSKIHSNGLGNFSLQLPVYYLNGFVPLNASVREVRVVARHHLDVHGTSPPNRIRLLWTGGLEIRSGNTSLLLTWERGVDITYGVNYACNIWHSLALKDFAHPANPFCNASELQFTASWNQAAMCNGSYAVNYLTALLVTAKYVTTTQHAVAQAVANPAVTWLNLGLASLGTALLILFWVQFELYSRRTGNASTPSETRRRRRTEVAARHTSADTTV